MSVTCWNTRRPDKNTDVDYDSLNAEREKITTLHPSDSEFTDIPEEYTIYLRLRCQCCTCLHKIT